MRRAAPAPDGVRGRNAAAPWIDRSTCVSAAKFRTASCPVDLIEQVAVEDVPLTKEYRGSASMLARLAGLPA